MCAEIASEHPRNFPSTTQRVFAPKPVKKDTHAILNTTFLTTGETTIEACASSCQSEKNRLEVGLVSSFA